MPQVIDQVIQTLEQGRRDHYMPPKFLLEKVVPQIQAIAAPAGEENVFGGPVKKFPVAVPEADQKALHDAVVKAVDAEVRPAFTKLANFMAKDYAQFGRTEPGLWSLPNGDALYRFAVKQQTTTNMDPEAIHELGLKEVARIHEEMLVIAKSQGFSDRKSFQESLKTNPKLIPKSREDISNLSRLYCRYAAGTAQTVWPAAKDASGSPPGARISRKEAAAAEYNQGTPDGSRPASSMSTLAILRIVLSSVLSQPPIMRLFPGITCRSPSRKRCPACRPSASKPNTLPIPKAGRFTPNAWQRHRFLQRSAQQLRPAFRRVVTRVPLGARYGRPLQALDPRANDHVLPRKFQRG